MSTEADDILSYLGDNSAYAGLGDASDAAQYAGRGVDTGAGGLAQAFTDPKERAAMIQQLNQASGNVVGKMNSASDQATQALIAARERIQNMQFDPQIMQLASDSSLHGGYLSDVAGDAKARLPVALAQQNFGMTKEGNLLQINKLLSSEQMTPLIAQLNNLAAQRRSMTTSDDAMNRLLVQMRGQNMSQTEADKRLEAALTKGQETTLPGGGKIPAGYQIDPADPTKVTPIIGGPQDPNTSKPIGAREAMVIGRSLTGAKESLADLQNVMLSPATATAGVFGIGASPSHSIMGSTIDSLRNKVSDQDTQSYNTLIPGLSRGLATIEASGMVPAGSFTHSFDNLILREGDTEETKLHKLAGARQAVENGMDVLVNNPRLPPQQQKYAQDIIDQVRKVIPFTHADIFNLSHAAPGTTIADMVKAHGLGGSTPAYDSEVQAEAAAAAGTLRSGDKVVIGGVKGTWH